MIKIPKIIHQIWVGGNPFPEEFARYQKSWTEKNPGWELMFWTEDNLPTDLRRMEVHERLRVPAERADILRLEVLWRYGGIYTDTDFECVRNIEEHIDDLEFFVADLKPGRTNNAVIGAIKGHYILDEALKLMKPRVYSGYDKAAAGPLFFDEMVKKHDVRNKMNMHVFEPKDWYPDTPSLEKEAIAIHHMARSWKGDDGFKGAALRAEQRLKETQALLFKVIARLKKYESVEEYEKLTTLEIIEGKKKAKKKKRKSNLKRYFYKVVWRNILVGLDKRNRCDYAERIDSLPSRLEFPEFLNRRELKGIGAEIGVKKGNFSEYLLTNWDCEKLISIDPWLEDAAENYLDKANVDQARHDSFYQAAVARLKNFGERSEIWRMTSVEAAEKVDKHSLDFVYIDARHDYESVLEDLNAWFDKVKPGGIFAGHDYADGHFEQGVFGVKKAVDEFFAEKGIPVGSTKGQYPVEMFASWLVEIPRK